MSLFPPASVFAGRFQIFFKPKYLSIGFAKVTPLNNEEHRDGEDRREQPQ